MSETRTSAGNSIGLFGLTFLLLLFLKLSGLAATLSWWWVFAPIIAGLSVFILVLVFVLIVAAGGRK